jgi:hypothetical protein
MPVVYGHNLRWVVDEADCTVCDKEYDGSWLMVKVIETDDLLCRDCLTVWRAEMKKRAESLSSRSSGASAESL